MKSGYVKIISVCLGAGIIMTGMPFTATSAENTPKLTIQTKSFNPDGLPENRIVEVDVLISDCTNGILASSFGISYDNALIYTGMEECTGKSQIVRVSSDTNGLKIANTGTYTSTAFETVSNPEKNLIWFVSANHAPQRFDSTEELMLKLFFQLSDDATEGGNFPVKFLWQGADGSPAYWYADKQTNLISEIQGKAENGGIKIHGGSSLNYTELRMNQDTQQQLTLYNVAGIPKWLSTNTKVATVSQDGIVTAVGAGECTIRVNIDRTFKDCHVVVNEADIYSILDETPLILKNPKRDVILEYPNAEGTVLWGSFEPSVIDIDENGKLSFEKGVSCMATIYSEYNGDAPMRDIYIEYTEEATEESTEESTEPLTEESTEESSEPFTEESTEESSELDTSEPPVYTLGDVDGNGDLDIIDVIIVNKAILGKEILTSEQNQAADFNQDSKINTSDSLEILKKIVGLT